MRLLNLLSILVLNSRGSRVAAGHENRFSPLSQFVKFGQLSRFGPAVRLSRLMDIIDFTD
jgi:hypothetical protein